MDKLLQIGKDFDDDMKRVGKHFDEVYGGIATDDDEDDNECECDCEDDDT